MSLRYDSYDPDFSLNPNGFTEGDQNQDLNAIEHAIRNEEQSGSVITHRFRFGSGASLILMVLITISIVCFAALSIVSAQADRRLTDHLQEQTDAYRTASNEAQQFLADTDRELRILYHSIDDRSDLKSAYFTAASRLDSAVDFTTGSDTAAASHLEDIRGVLANTGVSEDSSVVLVFTAPMTDTQEYLMVVQVLWPDDNAGRFYKVLSAKVLNTADYSYDSTLNVMKQP